MKKFLFLLILLLGMQSIHFAYSSSFQYMIDVMNLEESSVNGYPLNEEIYQQYNQFVYGSPLQIRDGQRWKDVPTGRWTKNGGAWKGSGTRGEYWVLGYNYSEKEIHNHQFPVDIEPPTPPTQWRYVPLSDAEKSWNNTEIYLHEEQKIYMQTTKLTRNQITYDLTALDIGLNKARVENYATWKTEGNIYTRRYDMNNKEWAANFIVPPMAGDASLEAKLYLPEGENYTIGLEENAVTIPIAYGCEAIHLTDYARPEHVKEIHAEIAMQGHQLDSMQAEKQTQLEKKKTITLYREDYQGQSDVVLELSCNAYLLTEFTVDGALTDIKTQKIYLHIEGEEEEKKAGEELKVKPENKNYSPEAIPPHIDSFTLGRQTENGIEPLPIAKKTGTEFICAGQVLAIEVETSNTDYITLEFAGDSSIITLDEITKRFEWTEPRERNVKTRYSSLRSLENAYRKVTTLTPQKTVENKSKFIYYYVIPYQTKQTLHSWSTLREISKDAFQIEESRLFTRIIKPYTVMVKAYSDDGVRSKSISLDVYERWDTLYNRDLTPYIKR